MRVLVLGAGATGAYFGARMIQSGAHVDFLVRPVRAQQMRMDGLTVMGHADEFSAKVPVLTEVPARGAYDLVLLSCKAYDLDSAIRAIAPAVRENTRVLPLLNGLRHLDVLDLAFGAQRVWGGVCHISVTLQQDGRVRQFGTLDRLTFGSRGVDPRIEALAPDLLKVPAQVRHGTSILDSLWEKFSFLATLAAMTAAMQSSVGEIAASEQGEALMRRCYAECADVAQRSGHPLSAAASDEALAILTATKSPLKASLLRDLERGGPNEIEHIVGDMLSRGERLGVSMPVLTTCATRLRLHAAANLRGEGQRAQ